MYLKSWSDLASCQFQKAPCQLFLAASILLHLAKLSFPLLKTCIPEWLSLGYLLRILQGTVLHVGWGIKSGFKITFTQVGTKEEEEGDWVKQEPGAL